MRKESTDTPQTAGSWVITRKASGEVIGEFYDRSIVARFNPDTCLIETALAYLQRINRAIREAGQ